MRVTKAIEEVLLPVASSVFFLEEEFPGAVPLFHIKQLPGIPSNQVWERIDRVQIELYANGPGQAFDLSKQAEELLQGWVQTYYGLIDKIQVEVPFYEEPIPHDTLNKQTSTYTVTYRI